MSEPAQSSNSRPEPAPFATAALPGIGGSIGPEPEDFRVSEIPAYSPTGIGEHLYVEVEKRELTTPELVRQLAEVAGVQAKDIGYAGLKDKHAVTSQWLSLPARSTPPETWALPSSVRLLQASRHGNKLRTGHLSGNRFAITLVGLSPEFSASSQAIAEHIQLCGLPNYFGDQRYGRFGDNLEKAMAWLKGGGRARLSSFLLKLYPSVVQSEVFNRYLTLRAGEGLDHLLTGDVVRLQGSAAVFLVEDAEREAPRLAAREIHLTGPMPGPKLRPASGRPLELEQQALDALALDSRTLEVLGKFAPGTRRDLLMYPENLTLHPLAVDRLRIEFTLSSGSYATVVIREFTRVSPGERDAVS